MSLRSINAEWDAMDTAIRDGLRRAAAARATMKGALPGHDSPLCNGDYCFCTRHVCAACGADAVIAIDYEWAHELGPGPDRKVTTELCRRCYCTRRERIRPVDP